MEPSPNPRSESLLRDPENLKKPMEKFQNLVLKLAQTRPNAPLTPAARTLLEDRLNQFVSDYKTPDHPPYSAMIERAIRELNEKQGSSEDSISRFLEREYNNLPWAHSATLKRHLGNLCVSGDIVVTRNKRYKLPREIPVPSPPNTKVKRDPSRRSTRWRWGWEKDKLRRLKKKKLVKLRIQQRGKKAKVVENHQERDERGNALILENDGNAISRDITILPNLEQQDGKQSEDTSPKILTPFESACFKDLPNLGLVEVEPMSATDKLFERHQEHDGKGQQLIGEIGQNPVGSDITILVAQEFKAVVSMGSVELVTSHGSEENHSLLLGHSNLEMPLKAPGPNPDQKHCENDSMPVKVDEVYCRRISEKVEPYFKKIDSPNIPLTLSPPETAPSNEKRRQELPPQHRKVSQPRRSLRLSLAKPKLAEVNEPTQHRHEDCPKINPPEEKPEKPIKTADCLEKPRGQPAGSRSQHFCAGPNNRDLMMSSDDGLGGQDPVQTPKRGRRGRQSKANT